MWLHATLVLAGQNRLSVPLSTVADYQHQRLGFYALATNNDARWLGREGTERGRAEKVGCAMRTISFGPLKLLSLKRHKMSIKIISQFSLSLSLSYSLTLSLCLALPFYLLSICPALCKHLNCAKLPKNSFAHEAFVCRFVPRIERLSCTFFLLAML